MSPDSASPSSSSLNRAHSPPSHSSSSRPRDGDSGLPWWEADRAQASTKPPSDSRSASRQHDRERAKHREPHSEREPQLDYGGRRQDGWRERDRLDHQAGHPRNRGPNNYRGGPITGPGGGAPYSHSGTSQYPNQQSPPRSSYTNLNDRPYDRRPGLDNLNRHRYPPLHSQPLPPSTRDLQPAAPVRSERKEPEPELELELPVEQDPAELLAERRRKREAILAKYAQPSAPTSGAGTPATAGQPSGKANPAKEIVTTDGSIEGEPAAKRQRIGGTGKRKLQTNEDCLFVNIG